MIITKKKWGAVFAAPFFADLTEMDKYAIMS